MTDEGRAFAEATVQAKKAMFRRALLAHVASAREIVALLTATPGHRMPAGLPLDTLERHFGAEEARRQLAVLVAWGRYAEAFAYDEATDSLYLEPEAVGAEAPAAS